MVQTKLVTSKDQPSLKVGIETLFRLAEEYSLAQRDWAEAFILHKMSDPKMTDGLARAKADVDVDVLGTQLQLEITMLIAREHGTISERGTNDA